MAKIKTENPATVNEDELTKLVDDRLSEAKQQGLERQWYLNIAYMTGKQWIAWDGIRKRLYEPPKEWWEERLVINRILPIVRKELAKLTKSQPQFQVNPQTNEDEDINAAKAANNVIEYIWRRTGMDDKRFKMTLWALTTGTGWLKTFWNPSLGDAITDEIGNTMHLGDVDVTVVSPFDFWLDPTAEEWEQVRWCVEQKLRTADYVFETYGVEVPPEENLVSTNVFSGMLATLNGFQNNDIRDSKVKDGVIVKEFWELPSKKYPKGRHVTVANGKLLQYEDNPYGQLPYFYFPYILVPGRVHGRASVEDLIPVQREYNKIRSLRRENQKRTGNQRMLVPQGSLLSDPTNEPGEILEYNPGVTKPEWQTPPAEPAHMQNELEMQLQDLNDISGQHEVSNGSAPPGVKSGTAIQFLQEQDDTMMGPTIQLFEGAFQKWAEFVLSLVEQYYTEERTIKIVGKNSKVEVIDFKGADIKGNRDVEVVAGSIMPQSKAARQDFVLNLWDRGIIKDPQTALKLLEFGSIEQIYEDISIDLNQAQSEHKRWLNGDFSPAVRDFYNHEIHISEHNKFRKGDDYEALPPQAQQEIDQHVAEHQQFMQQQIMQQMQTQFQAKPPVETINFKDLTSPQAQVQMLAQAGIQAPIQQAPQPGQQPDNGTIPNNPADVLSQVMNGGGQNG